MNLSALEKEVLATIDPEEVVALLQAIIQQRSDYPPGDCRAAVGVLAELLSETGVRFKLHAREEHQPNLIASLGGSQDEPARLMYHAHIDTVPPGELERWSVDPFGGEIKDGFVYGRGAGDDKGSVAVQAMALLTLARAGLSLAGPLRLVVVSDEVVVVLDKARKQNSPVSVTISSEGISSVTDFAIWTSCGVRVSHSSPGASTKTS